MTTQRAASVEIFQHNVRSFIKEIVAHMSGLICAGVCNRPTASTDLCILLFYRAFHRSGVSTLHVNVLGRQLPSSFLAVLLEFLLCPYMFLFFNLQIND